MGPCEFGQFGFWPRFLELCGLERSLGQCKRKTNPLHFVSSSFVWSCVDFLKLLGHNVTIFGATWYADFRQDLDGQ